MKSKVCYVVSRRGWVHGRSFIQGEVMHTSLRRKRWLFRTVLFTALAAILVWEVTSRTLSAYLANVAPEHALAIRARQTAALLNLADQKLDEFESTASAGTDARSLNSDPAVNQQIRELAVQALSDDPLNSRALRILGQLADRSRDETRAWLFMRTSARYSMNESFAVAWLVDKSFEKKEYGDTLNYADVLLRTRPQLISYIMPTLVQIAENKDASSGLRKLLSSGPPWRAQFFDALPNSISDARTPLDLLLAAKDSPHPPTTDDLRGYLYFLIEHKFYALAYYAWLQFLPAEQLSSLGPLFNGSFETVPSGLPFDWVITPGSGVTIDIAPAPDRDGERALVVAFEQGRVDFRGVTQLIMLAPGKYRFNGKYTGEMIGQRGLKWRVTCAGGAMIGESGMVAGRASTWKDLEFPFAVPGADCPAQFLRLDLDARMSSEQFASGTLWFDDLRVARLADTAQK
jgi:hypothetical protein